jgi:hypothetical protein
VGVCISADIARKKQVIVAGEMRRGLIPDMSGDHVGFGSWSRENADRGSGSARIGGKPDGYFEHLPHSGVCGMRFRRF